MGAIHSNLHSYMEYARKMCERAQSLSLTPEVLERAMWVDTMRNRASDLEQEEAESDSASGGSSTAGKGKRGRGKKTASAKSSGGEPEPADATTGSSSSDKATSSGKRGRKKASSSTEVSGSVESAVDPTEATTAAPRRATRSSGKKTSSSAAGMTDPESDEAALKALQEEPGPLTRKEMKVMEEMVPEAIQSDITEQKGAVSKATGLPATTPEEDLKMQVDANAMTSVTMKRVAEEGELEGEPARKRANLEAAEQQQQQQTAQIQ